MKVAIFARPRCPLAVETLRLFRRNSLPMALVIVETAVREKFSDAERAFKAAHAEFDRWLTQRGAGSLESTGLVVQALRLPRRVVRKLRGWLAGDPLEAEARRSGARLITVGKHSSAETRDLLEREGISWVLLASSAWLIKEPLLSMPGTRIINAHCAKLPQHRSLDALSRSVLAGDELGLTAHFVDAGIDTGPILDFMPVESELGDNLNTLRAKVDALAPELLRRCVAGLRDSTIQPRVQRPEDGTHHSPMTFAQLCAAEGRLQERIAARRTRSASVPAPGAALSPLSRP